MISYTVRQIKKPIDISHLIEVEWESFTYENGVETKSNIGRVDCLHDDFNSDYAFILEHSHCANFSELFGDSKLGNGNNCQVKIQATDCLFDPLLP